MQDPGVLALCDLTNRVLAGAFVLVLWLCSSSSDDTFKQGPERVEEVEPSRLHPSSVGKTQQTFGGPGGPTSGVEALPRLEGDKPR